MFQVVNEFLRYTFTMFLFIYFKEMSIVWFVLTLCALYAHISDLFLQCLLLIVKVKENK